MTVQEMSFEELLNMLQAQETIAADTRVALGIDSTFTVPLRDLLRRIVSLNQRAESDDLKGLESLLVMIMALAQVAGIPPLELATWVERWMAS